MIRELCNCCAYQTSRTFGYPNCYHKQPNEEEDNSHHETGDHKWRKFSQKAPKVWILAALRDILTEREYEYVVCFGRVEAIKVQILLNLTTKNENYSYIIPKRALFNTHHY